MKTDVIVLGAGIIGVSAALHLQKKGRKVVLVDRRGIGEETSSGNAGMLVRAGIRPYHFPKDPVLLARSITKQFGGFNYHPQFLLTHFPWLISYAWHSRAQSIEQISADMLPLIETCVTEHQALALEAGAQKLLHAAGWLTVYRSEKSFRRAVAAAQGMAKKYNLDFDVIERQQLAARFPIKVDKLQGGLYWRDPYSCSNPESLVKAYGALFERNGGVFIRADARNVTGQANQWRLSTPSTSIEAKEIVVALGAWSKEIYEPLGYRFPMVDKRGYHMHYKSSLPDSFHTPVTDMDHGYVLAPMEQGLRMTTGVELAARDAPYTPVQLKRLETIAKDIVDLGQRADSTAWMGTRPCFADMRPIVGAAQNHAGLWFCFGHNHVGFSVGPGCGKLLAEMMTGDTLFMNPLPFSPNRFS